MKKNYKMFFPELCSLTENCFYLIMEIGMITSIFASLATFIPYILYLMLNIIFKEHINEIKDIINEENEEEEENNIIKRQNNPTEIIGLGFEVLGLVKDFLV